MRRRSAAVLLVLSLGVLGAAVFAAIFPQASSVRAVTFTVDSTGDGGDSNPADGVCNDGTGSCTLRAAIEQANANAGTDTIAFSIGSGVQTISPLSALPTITDPLTIDGTTQPCFAGTPIIELNGTSAGASVDGLKIAAGNSTVSGLVINRFGGDGIEITSNGGNAIKGNFIGTDVVGSLDLGNSLAGVFISNSPNNIVGGTAVEHRNVISGNNSGGVQIACCASGNLVQGNLIGTMASGSAVDLPPENCTT